MPQDPPSPAGDEATIAANLAVVRDRIAGAARAAGRDPAAITLVAVSKTQPAARIAQAGQAPISAPGSPIRQPLEPRPTTNVTPTERGGHER